MSLRDRRNRQDSFYRKAKSAGFAARAVYKFEEIDRKFQLVKQGDRVLDLGCWPGSWLQYLGLRVGPTGSVVGIDLEPVSLRFGPNVRVECGDMLVVEATTLKGDLAAFDVVVSDAAPNTTGIRITDQARSEELFARALTLAETLLDGGGHFVGKIFDGPGVCDLRARMARQFQSVRDVRPSGSRPGSTERYLVGIGYALTSRTHA